MPRGQSVLEAVGVRDRGDGNSRRLHAPRRRGEAGEDALGRVRARAGQELRVVQVGSRVGEDLGQLLGQARVVLLGLDRVGDERLASCRGQGRLSEGRRTVGDLRSLGRVVGGDLIGADQAKLQRRHRSHGRVLANRVQSPGALERDCGIDLDRDPEATCRSRPNAHRAGFLGGDDLLHGELLFAAHPQVSRIRVAEDLDEGGCGLLTPGERGLYASSILFFGYSI